MCDWLVRLETAIPDRQTNDVLVLRKPSLGLLRTSLCLFGPLALLLGPLVLLLGPLALRAANSVGVGNNAPSGVIHVSSLVGQPGKGQSWANRSLLCLI